MRCLILREHNFVKCWIINEEDWFHFSCDSFVKHSMQEDCLTWKRKEEKQLAEWYPRQVDIKHQGM